MIQEILGAFASFTGAMKKEAVREYVDFLFNSINDEVLPTFDILLQDKSLDVIKKNTYLKTVAQQADLRGDGYKALERIQLFFTQVSKSQKDIKSLVEKHCSEVITNKELKAKDAAIVKFLTDIYTITSYTLDFVYFIIVDEKHSELPKFKFKKIKEGMANYITLLKSYSKFYDEMVSDIAKMDDDSISVDMTTAQQQMKEMVLAKKSKLTSFPFSSFIGNPIYHIRMWLVDKEIEKLEALKLKKQLIELKVHELRLNNDGGKDPNLAKQIAYYEDKLASIEYKIEKIEKI